MNHNKIINIVLVLIIILLIFAHSVVVKDYRKAESKLQLSQLTTQVVEKERDTALNFLCKMTTSSNKCNDLIISNNLINKLMQPGTKIIAYPETRIFLKKEDFQPFFVNLNKISIETTDKKVVLLNQCQMKAQIGKLIDGPIGIENLIIACKLNQAGFVMSYSPAEETSQYFSCSAQTRSCNDYELLPSRSIATTIGDINSIIIPNV